MKNKKKNVIILGSGPTGLITAWKLLEKGLNVTIIEKNPNSGGLCRSWKHNGFILDTGPHIFHTPEPELKTSAPSENVQLESASEYPSPSVSGQPFLSKVEEPERFGQSSSPP